MATLLKKSANPAYTSSAKVVDGNLIISLPDAINPVVWRMELGSVKASALEVKPHDNNGTFMLSLKTPRGDVHDIAPFAKRDEAVAALMSVSAALQGAHGQIAPAAAQAAVPAPSSLQPAGKTGYKWLIVLAGVLVVIFLFSYLSGAGVSRIDGNSPQGSETATSVTGSPEAENGVAQSADQMLKGF